MTSISLLKSVYQYKYIGNWERFKKITLPEEKDVYSHLNIKDVTDADYMYTKRFSIYFQIKSLGKYHYLYVQSDIFFLADVFSHFHNMFLEIYVFDPAHVLSVPRLA